MQIHTWSTNYIDDFFFWAAPVFGRRPKITERHTFGVIFFLVSSFWLCFSTSSLRDVFRSRPKKIHRMPVQVWIYIISNSNHIKLYHIKLGIETRCDRSVSGFTTLYYIIVVCIVLLYWCFLQLSYSNVPHLLLNDSAILYTDFPLSTGQISPYVHNCQIASDKPQISAYSIVWIT